MSKHGHSPTEIELRFIENWWGEPVGSALSGRISNAPPSHVAAFVAEYNSLYGNAQPPPALSSGHIRPEVRTTKSDILIRSNGNPMLTVWKAPAILLYAHE